MGYFTLVDENGDVTEFEGLLIANNFNRTNKVYCNETFK